MNESKQPSQVKDMRRQRTGANNDKAENAKAQTVAGLLSSAGVFGIAVGGVVVIALVLNSIFTEQGSKGDISTAVGEVRERTARPLAEMEADIDERLMRAQNELEIRNEIVSGEIKTRANDKAARIANTDLRLMGDILVGIGADLGCGGSMLLGESASQTASACATAQQYEDRTTARRNNMIGEDGLGIASSDEIRAWAGLSPQSEGEDD